MARNTRSRRARQTQFIILSVLVVFSMALSLVAVLNPTSNDVPPTPTNVPIVITLPSVQPQPTVTPTLVLTPTP